MPGHIEWLCAHVGILRLGGAYGEPYYWSVVVKREPRGRASLHGLVAGMSRNEWRGVSVILASCGIDWAWYYRMKHGKREKHEHPTRRGGGRGQITRMEAGQ